MQNAGMTVTAAAPMSGPYALAAFGDAIFEGQVNASGTANGALLIVAYQKAYGDIYATPADAFESKYAPSIETLLPSTTSVSDLVAQGRFPPALFSSTPPSPSNAIYTPGERVLTSLIIDQCVMHDECAADGQGAVRLSQQRSLPGEVPVVQDMTEDIHVALRKWVAKEIPRQEADPFFQSVRADVFLEDRAYHGQVTSVARQVRVRQGELHRDRALRGAKSDDLAAPVPAKFGRESRTRAQTHGGHSLQEESQPFRI
jgi:hypothetical protein